MINQENFFRPIAWFSLLLALSCFNPALPFAQASTEAPAGASADAVESKVTKDAKEEILASKSSEPSDIKQETGETGKIADARFFIRKIHFYGSQILPPEALESFFSEYENREVTFTDLKHLGDRLEQEFRSRGYFAVVFIPPQKVEHGEVSLRAVVSRMGDLHLKGARYFRDWKTGSYWKIPKGEVLRYDRIKSGVLSMNENPDRAVQAILRPGSSSETSDVYLDVKDRLPMHTGFSFDNRGIKLIGKDRPGFTFRHNNLIGFDDIFLAGTVFGSDFGALYTQYMIPLYSQGTRFFMGFSHAQVTPKKDIESFHVNGISDTYSFALRQTVYRTARSSAEIYVGFDFNEKRTRSLSLITARDRIRMFSLGGNFETVNEAGAWNVGQDLFFGLPIYGGDSLLRSRDADTSFVKYHFLARREQKLPWNTKAVLNIEGQVTPDKLIPQQQFFIGGATTVRGYPESDYGADQAVLINAEYWMPCFLFPEGSKLPNSKKDLRQTVKFLVFTDYGHGWMHDASDSEHAERDLLGAGCGIDVRLDENISMRFEWGARLGNPALTENGSSQFHFRFKADF